MLLEARDVTKAFGSFQVPQTFEGMTVLENVMIGAFLRTPHRAQAEAKARAVLERVGMSRLADAPARSAASGWRSHVRSPPNPRCCCSTKRWPVSPSGR